MKTSRLIARGLKKKIEAFEKAVAKHNKRRPSKENDAKILRLVKEMTGTFELAVKTKRVFGLKKQLGCYFPSFPLNISEIILYRLSFRSPR